jgi:hypothetical protein
MVAVPAAAVVRAEPEVPNATNTTALADNGCSRGALDATGNASNTFIV